MDNGTVLMSIYGLLIGAVFKNNQRRTKVLTWNAGYFPGIMCTKVCSIGTLCLQPVQYCI